MTDLPRRAVAGLAPPAVTGVALLTVLLTVEGLLATRFGWASFEFRRAVLALAAGWSIAAAGTAAWTLVPSSRTGPLLVACGAASFLGPLAERWVPDGPVVNALAWAWIAILGQAILAQPDGRLRTPVSLVLAIGLYLVTPTVSGADPWPMAVALAVVLVLRQVVDGSRGRRGSDSLAGIVAVAGMAAPTTLATLAPGLPIDGWALAVAGPACAAVLLAADAIRLTPSPVRATDAVLRLPLGTFSVTDELRHATGDPSLDLAIPGPDADRYVDLRGRTVVPPAPGASRVATPIALPDGTIALAIHDRRAETDEALVAASARAVALAGANARLQAELRAQVADVTASRRRLVEVADAERSALERRLEAEVRPRLDAVAEALGPDEPARGTVIEVRESLARLAHGLHPRALDRGDLGSALDVLVVRSPVPVLLEIQVPASLPTAIATAAWFTCSEALTNAAKHASPSRVVIRAVDSGTTLDVAVEDDGRGGADPGAGTGLRGLIDRANALGGDVEIRSLPGAGTRIDLRLPLDGGAG